MPSLMLSLQLSGVNEICQDFLTLEMASRKVSEVKLSHFAQLMVFTSSFG